jgi:hypothetical protein
LSVRLADGKGWLPVFAGGSGGPMTRKPISYAAEVVIDFPEKTFIGSFSRSGAYEVDADAEAVTLRLMRTRGARRSIELRLEHHLLAEMLADLAEALTAKALPAEPDRGALRRAAERLRAATSDPLPG